VKRIRDWIIEHEEAVSIINRYDSEDTFFYIDPPYIQSERCDKRYKVDYTEIEHLELLMVLAKVKGMVLLSGYDNDLYCKHLNGWFKKQYTVVCKAVGNTRSNNVMGEGSLDNHKRIETLWYNYPEPERRLF
jgi:DNA adenine methylase